MPTYFICEIGQNHNGSMDIARQLIDTAAMPIEDSLFDRRLPGADAVKFTKRDLTQELSASMMNQPYPSEHSFGATYGEHRAFLELSDAQHYELYRHAKTKGLDFVETLCSPKCLGLLRYFSPDRLKVASRDLTNLPLIEAMAETRIPMILSTGMTGRSALDEALGIITKHHAEVTILHCLSEYPARYENINLRTIVFLQEQYPDFTIGYSDHSIGIMAPVAAVTLGAQVIEKHVTLDRSMKGSDHAGSLEPEGLWRVVRDIRNLEQSLGIRAMVASEAAAPARRKLQRSIATRRPLKRGRIIRQEDLHLLSPGDGFLWSQRRLVVGQRLAQDVPANEIIYRSMLAPTRTRASKIARAV